MKCPFCSFADTRVIDSRPDKDGAAIRRRRECESCSRRFTTHERVEEVVFPLILKKDGRREAYDRGKVIAGMKKACEKRPVAMARLAEIVDEIETKLTDSAEREISTTEIGEILMARLKALDKIAYVRFASVYRDFQDVEAFLNELKHLIRQKRK